MTIKAATTALRRRAERHVQKAIPALAYLASLIGDPAVRYRGTIGGSLANNDPGGGLSGSSAGARRDREDQQALDRRPTTSSRACSRRRSRTAKSSPPYRSRFRPRRVMPSFAIRPRALR